MHHMHSQFTFVFILVSCYTFACSFQSFTLSFTNKMLKRSEFILFVVCGIIYFCIYNAGNLYYKYDEGSSPTPAGQRLESTETVTIPSTAPVTTVKTSATIITTSTTSTPTEYQSQTIFNYVNYSAPISASNYFQHKPNVSGNAFSGKLLISQPKCNIPEINLWSFDSMKSYGIRKPLECLKGVNGSIPGLTFVNKTKLQINTDHLKSLNLSFEDIQCCYQIVQQIPQLKEFDDKFFKNKILSDFCLPINEPSIIPISNQIKVSCFHRNNSETEFHHDYHILANLEPQTYSLYQGKKLSRKIKYWKDKPEIPPSIHILGLDCGNRLNVRRQMPETVKYLESLDAFEMLGYTKVGAHTSSNIIPALSSYYMEELEKSCGFEGRSIDNCPWIFANWSDINYVTSFIEDGNSFQSGRDRFLIPPTDYYHIPWMRYIHREAFNDDYNICLENKTKYDVMLDYMQNLAETMAKNKLPYFHFSWVTDLAHDSFNGYQEIDKYLMKSLEYLNTSGYLDNTIFIIMGDHGYRWYPIRHTISGWYEDKQPAMWILLPPKLIKKHPEFKQALAYNKDKLSCPFDLHQTFRHVISLTSGRPMEHAYYGASLFKNLPVRTCDIAGIPIGYCPCSTLLPFKSADRPLLKNAAVSIIDDPKYKEFEKKGFTKCKKMKIKKIIAAAVQSDTHQNLTDDDLEQLIVSKQNNFVLGVELKEIEDAIEIEFILNFNPTRTPQFEVLYSFGVDSTNAKKIEEKGYYYCE